MTGQQFRNQLRGALRLIVIVAGNQARTNAQFIEQPACATRVLGRNARDIREDVAGPNTDIIQIADRRRDNEKCARSVACCIVVGTHIGS